MSNQVWDETFDGLLREALGLPVDGGPIEPAADLMALGLDSVGAIGLIVALEDAYDVTFPVDTMHPDTFVSPAHLWASLREAMRSTA